MSKVVIIKSKAGVRAASRKPASVSEKRVRDPASGKPLIIRSLEMKSETFGRDLAYVFSKNVATARRENKRVIGDYDRTPSKA